MPLSPFCGVLSAPYLFFFFICVTAEGLCLIPCILSKVHSYSWVKFALVQVECFKRTVARILYENLTEIQGALSLASVNMSSGELFQPQIHCMSLSSSANT